MEKYDVAIIGAGPGGLEAAKILSENNKKVIVLEKNSIIGKKVCGGGITTKDFTLGVDSEIADRQFNEVTLRTPLSSCKIKSSKPYVATIAREKLGSFLAKEDRLEGVKIVTDTEVEKVDKNTLKTKNGIEIEFDYLIGADGSESLVRKYLGLETKKILIAFHYKVPKYYKDMELIFNAKLFGSAFAWIFPHKDFTSIGSGIDPNYYPGADGIQKNFVKWASDNGIILNEDWREAWVINYDYRGFQFDNIFLVGDAGGFASGLTGEGIYFAMISGAEVARKIIDDSYDTPKIKSLLAIKKDHEKILQLLRTNRFGSQIIYSIAGLVFKTHLFDKKIIKNFS